MRRGRYVVMLMCCIVSVVGVPAAGAHTGTGWSPYWKSGTATLSTSSGTCAAYYMSPGWMNDPKLTYDRAAGRLDYDVSWTPGVELVGYKIKTDYRAISSTGVAGPWQYGGVMSAWSTDCRYGPAHGFLWVAPAHAYELRFLRQDGSVVDYTTVYGFAKTTHEFDPPVAPKDFRAAVDSDSVFLEWTDTAGETSYRVERSQDGFATIQRSWDLAADATSLDDVTTQPASDYAYRIQATNAAGGSSFAGPLKVFTRNVFVPDVPGIDEAIATNCGGDQPGTLTIELCVRQEMRTYSVYVATVRICETQNGVSTGVCSPYVFVAPKSPPNLPDDDDPSVPPPPRYPDGSVWKPASEPGAPEWGWGSDLEDFPTSKGSWYRSCANGLNELLHWDSDHEPPKPGHWGYKDCDGNFWEMPFEWLQYGKEWLPRGKEWWT